MGIRVHPHDNQDTDNAHEVLGREALRLAESDRIGAHELQVFILAAKGKTSDQVTYLARDILP